MLCAQVRQEGGEHGAVINRIRFFKVLLEVEILLLIVCRFLLSLFCTLLLLSIFFLLYQFV